MLHGAGAAVQREVQHQVRHLVSRLSGVGAVVPQPAQPKQGGSRRTGTFFIIMIKKTGDSCFIFLYLAFLLYFVVQLAQQKQGGSRCTGAERPGAYYY